MHIYTHNTTPTTQMTFQNADGTTTQLSSGSLFPSLNDDDTPLAAQAAVAELVDKATGERVLDVQPGRCVVCVCVSGLIVLFFFK